MRRLIIVLTISLLSYSSFSQKRYDYATIDAKITAHYLNGNWDSVIYYGKAGLADSIDYFYLRKHLGEAYYYKQNYLSAIPHFETAVRQNSKETFTLELLYYAYLFSGRVADARALELQMPEAALSDIKAKKKSYIESVYFEAGTSRNNNFTKNENTDFNGKPNTFGAAEMSGNIAYGHLGIKAQLSHKVSIYIGGGFLREQKKTIFDVTNLTPNGRNITQRDTVVWKPFPMPGHYTHDTIIENLQKFNSDPVLYINDNTLRQNEFYLNCNIHASKGLEITPFIHLLNARFTTTIPHSSNLTAHDSIETHTQYYFPTPPGAWTDTVFYYDSTYTVASNYMFRTRDTVFVNFSLGFAINKSFGHFNTSFFCSLSNLNRRSQKQLGVSATWFPLGNLNLYLNASFTGCKQTSTNTLVKSLLVGKKLFEKVWMEGSFTMGDMNNFTERNGFIVNNNPDIVKYRFILTPILTFKHFDIIMHYQYQEKQGSYFFKNGSGAMTEKTFNYQNQLISGGIKWKI
jgi:hypothetical protein